MASPVVAWGSMWVLPGEQKARGGAGTWALLAAVGGADAHRVGTGEPWALHLLAVHFTRGALRGVQGLMWDTGQLLQGSCTSAWFEPLLQCPAAEGTHGCWGSPSTRPDRGTEGGLGPALTLQVQMAHLMRPKGGTTGCQRVPEPRHVLSPSK